MFFCTLLSRTGFPVAAATAAARSAARQPIKMPLRAKMQVPAQAMSMSTGPSGDRWKAQPGDEAEDVLFNSLYGLRTIELNRPRKFNSLNGSMIRKIVPRLLEWERSDMANVVVLKGAGDKALCAGGDVAALAAANRGGPAGQQWSADYFAQDYQLDHLIATYAKPYVALMDGITMGGGVGLSVHAPLRVATERTVFAMPETNIGFFPDVGASFFLPRMPGAVGTYLALTSERLVGADVLYAGLATHYLHSTSLPALEARLAELRFRDYDDNDARLDAISAAIEELATGLPHDRPPLLAGELRRAIDRCFGLDSVNAIVAALQAETVRTDSAGSSDAVRAWATRSLETLAHRSPTAVHVTLRQMRVGGAWSIAETFRREHQIASRFMRHPDFVEGVEALLVRKDGSRPQWQPNTLAVVSDADNITEPFFAPPSAADNYTPLPLLNDRDFRDYPHRRLGLPSEADVETLARDGSLSPREIVNYLVGRSRAKQGVKEVVEEIVARKTTKNANGKAAWIYEDEQ
ncbi:crotonase [Grosmannia clavigera kw1407]|uniref:3-hydroxyisobutyryl-CoA hydrolase n=1 Tax=Grosmannia clavigera (strain kw1407 / UAMH 11150) TaxID=655863 RepID=F0XEA1_GROCL|nr:crotonase [Grosmannia clavigera kw1407]EFX03685.1 crotonase [Grosmannia clavigera kw1407]